MQAFGHHMLELQSPSVLGMLSPMMRLSTGLITWVRFSQGLEEKVTLPMVTLPPEYGHMAIKKLLMP